MNFHKVHAAQYSESGSRRKILLAQPKVLVTLFKSLSPKVTSILTPLTQRFVLLTLELNFPFHFLITPTQPGTSIHLVIQQVFREHFLCARH